MAGKLTMTKGLPASGKSTWAMAQPDSVVVCKDDIRAELFQKNWDYDKEKEVLRVRDFRISAALSKGKHAISADTNLAPKHEARLREIAKRYKAEFIVNDMFLVLPIDELIRRDKARDGGVGEKVIIKMLEENLKPSDHVERTAQRGHPQLFLDLDGVLADFDGFIEKELGIVNNRENEDPNFWDKARAYKGRLYYDMKPLQGASTLYKALKGFKPIILTGCPWSIPTAADDKRQWVKENIDPDVQVICCKSRNKSLYMQPGDVLLDDWNKYQALWEAKGGTFVLHKNVEESIRRVTNTMEGA